MLKTNSSDWKRKVCVCQQFAPFKNNLTIPIALLHGLILVLCVELWLTNLEEQDFGRVTDKNINCLTVNYGLVGIQQQMSHHV